MKEEIKKYNENHNNHAPNLKLSKDKNTLFIRNIKELILNPFYFPLKESKFKHIYSS